MDENPFEVLQLSPQVSPEEAVRQAARLTQCAADEVVRDRIRQAIQKLTSSREGWALYALLTHPGVEYQQDEFERFVSRHRRPPAVQEQELPAAEVDQAEIRQILLAQLARQQSLDPLPLEPLSLDESKQEIEKQTAEAIWQGRVGEMGA